MTSRRNDLPRDFQAVIEIPLGSNVKYELDKATGLLKVDRIIHSAVFYSRQLWLHPANLCGRTRSARRIGSVPGAGAAAGTDSSPGHRLDDHDRFRRQRRKVIAVATNDPEFSGYVEARDLPSHRFIGG